MSTLKQVQLEVAHRMRRGESFAAVEEELIDPSALSDAEKAAVWLYGWSFVNWRLQRREAGAHIDRLDEAAVPVARDRFGPRRPTLPAGAR